MKLYRICMLYLLSCVTISLCNYILLCHGIFFLVCHHLVFFDFLIYVIDFWNMSSVVHTLLYDRLVLGSSLCWDTSHLSILQYCISWSITRIFSIPEGYKGKYFLFPSLWLSFWPIRASVYFNYITISGNPEPVLLCMWCTHNCTVLYCVCVYNRDQTLFTQTREADTH